MHQKINPHDPCRIQRTEGIHRHRTNLLSLLITKLCRQLAAGTEHSLGFSLAAVLVVIGQNFILLDNFFQRTAATAVLIPQYRGVDLPQRFDHLFNHNLVIILKGLDHAFMQLHIIVGNGDADTAAQIRRLNDERITKTLCFFEKGLLHRLMQCPEKPRYNRKSAILQYLLHNHLILPDCPSQNTAADIGYSDRFQISLKGAVFPVGSMQNREHQINLLIPGK